ncbi:MAG: M81 family metallopeptidase [Roseobacter sp.]
MRIAIAGFQHETNTFVEKLTELDDFLQADSWPEMLIEQAVMRQTHGMNLPIAGFISAAKEAGDTVLPILWCSAEPGGRVTDHAFETITGRIIAALERVMPLDAVYLDLHGAMVTESDDDGEGALLARLRQTLGDDIPLIASLDLHANVTARMVEASDVLTVYRTYPHIDMAATGARAHKMMHRIHQHGSLAKVWQQGTYLIPLHAQHTGAGPARSLYEGIASQNGSADALVECALGFTAADIADVGPAILAYAASQSVADALVAQHAAALARLQPDFDVPLLTPSQAVARGISADPARPVVIADVQDNPGAGAASDTTGLLRELIAQKAPSTLLGVIHDPELAAQTHHKGEGARFQAQIGGRGQGDTPLHTAVDVERLSDGRVRYSGEMYGGGIGSLGPSACLRVRDTDIRFVVSSIRNQCLDLAHFRHFGCAPESARIVCVKSTAHFRADFEPIAQEVLLAAAPGAFPCVLHADQYTQLRPGVHVGRTRIS